MLHCVTNPGNSAFKDFVWVNLGSMAKQGILVIGFNRPDLLHQTLGPIARYGPKKLYFACDGPRLTHPKDNDLVAQSRKSFEAFSWSSAVETRFPTQNLGLRRNMVEAIDWFFRHEPEGIILEDDCVPTVGFFRLMDHILHKYRNDPRVWGATGSNPSGAPVTGSTSYGFIRSAMVWGWASWADRWASYDRNLVEYRGSGLAGKRRLWQDPFEYHALDWHLRQVAAGRLNTSWAYSWSWTVTHNDGLWAVPAQNLVSNVGFRSDATNTYRLGTLDHRAGTIAEIISPAAIERDSKLQHHIHRRQHRVLRPLWLNYLRNIYRASPARGLVRALLSPKNRLWRVS